MYINYSKELQKKYKRIMYKEHKNFFSNVYLSRNKWQKIRT